MITPTFPVPNFILSEFQLNFCFVAAMTNVLALNLVKN